MTQQSSASMILLLAFLIVLSAGIAGCTSQAPSAGQAPATSPAADKTPSATDLSAMVLQPSEIPGNFTLVDARERTAFELSAWALDHGWKKGYSVTYRKNDRNSGTIIRQNISVYSGENATLAVSDTIDGQVDSIARGNDTSLSVEKITITPIGDASGALKYSDKSDNSGMYVIAFAKTGVFEDIETNGTAADYETARQLATIAATKIR
jgi:hypothetical protein